MIAPITLTPGLIGSVGPGLGGVALGVRPPMGTAGFFWGLGRAALRGTLASLAPKTHPGVPVAGPALSPVPTRRFRCVFTSF